jgi:hypothetical protein
MWWYGGDLHDKLEKPQFVSFRCFIDLVLYLFFLSKYGVGEKIRTIRL